MSEKIRGKLRKGAETKSKNLSFFEAVAKALPLSYELAVDIAAWTNTYLILTKGGKPVKVKPPYKYVRVYTRKKS